MPTPAETLKTITQLLDAREVPDRGDGLLARIELLIESRLDAEGALTEATAINREIDDAVWFLRHGAVIVPMVNGVIEQVQAMTKPWSKLAEYQQNELIASIRRRITAQCMVAMKLLSVAQHPGLTAELIDFKIKKDTVTAKLEAAVSDQNVLALTRARQQEVTIIFFDQKLLDDGTEDQIKGEPDQPTLEVVIPEDDTDLADAPAEA